MAMKKRPEALNSPVSSQNYINNQFAHAQTPNDGANYDLPNGSSNEGSQALDTGIVYHQHATTLDGASHERKDMVPIRAAALGERIDDESSSKAKMWDPVKDCSDPNTIQADLPGFLSARHSNGEQFMDSTLSGYASMGLQLSYGNHSYGQVQDNQQHFMHSVTRGVASTSQQPSHQPHGSASGYQRGASMGLVPDPQSHAMASGYQGSSLMGSQPIQIGHSYDQFQRSYQDRIGHEKISTLHPHLRDPSGQQGQDSMELIRRGAALMGVRPRQASNLHENLQESRQQFAGMESRMLTSMTSHESAPRQSLLSVNSDLLMPRRQDPQQANRPQNPSAHMSQASDMACYAETLSRQFNRTEAVRAYEQACTLFQEVIIRSCSFEERMQCNDARNNCLARLDVLLQELAASPSNAPPGQNDQQDDDGPGGGKPQYSLFEDWTLCRKVEEELSWQEVAETSIFKGRRKHRSLSQRKHTIGKMGPKSQESEKPWTEDENRKLCAMGDMGKTLGDIHRKFRSRNAEQCLNQYFYLKGYHATGRSRTSTSRQARHTPALDPLSTKNTLHSSVVTRRPAYPLYPSTSVTEPVSHHQSKSTPPQPNSLSLPTSDQSNPSVFMLGSQTPGGPSSSPSFAGVKAPMYSAASVSSNNASASNETLTPQIQDSSNPSRRQRQAAPSSSPSSTLSLSNSDIRGSKHPASSMSAQAMVLSALGGISRDAFGNPASQEAVGNEITRWSIPSQGRNPAMSSSSSLSTANSPADSISNMSSPATSATMLSPLERHKSLDSHSAAANQVRKSPRSARFETI